MRFAISLFILSGLTLPHIARAQPSDLKDLIFILIDLVDLAIPVLVVLAMLAFAWGIANFILYADNEEKRKESKQILVWGIIALFLITAIGGILAVLENTFFGF